MQRVLVVDDEANMCTVLTEVLKEVGYGVSVARSGREGVSKASDQSFDAVIVDLKLPDMSGIDVIRLVKQRNPRTVVIMITAYSSVETAIEAMKLGAYDYIIKPFKTDKLKMVVKNALDGAKDLKGGGPRASHLGTSQGFDGIIGTSREMNHIFDLLSDLAPTNATVLIYGESGTGKELIARHIHRISLRANKPFIVVNCAALPETLLESELFGHEKGAFTSAVAQRIGRFEAANSGTIFLDEIGEMSLAMQAKLLRVLQEKEFQRVGGTESIRVDVRIVAATNKDLDAAIAAKAFRGDLYYRLSVVPIFLPPLRERKTDIPVLCEAFIAKFNREFRKNVQCLSPQATEKLLGYDWPGNIRELENCIERAMIMTKGDIILPESLYFCGHPINRVRNVEVMQRGEECSLEAIERLHIISVLRETDNNRTEAAKRLQITRRTLLNKIKKYELRQ